MMHEHDFREPIISRGPLSNHGGPPFEFITGWRCACGATSSFRGSSADLFGPKANVAAAARYVAERYGLKITSAVRPRGHEEEHRMADTTIPAPRNPYRAAERAGRDGEGLLGGWAAAGRSPRRFDTEYGPGLTAGDLDRIARDHFHDGFAAAERAGEKVAEELRGQLAGAFDEGYTAGRVERAQGLARDFHARCFVPALALTRALEGPKVGMRARVEEAQAALDDAMQFAVRLAGHEGTNRAAAQVARDEG